MNHEMPEHCPPMDGQVVRWTFLLVLFACAVVDLAGAGVMLETARLQAIALERCEHSIGCCSTTAERLAEKTWHLVRLSNSAIHGAWLCCAVATVALAVRSLWCTRLPRAVRWGLVIYALYTAVWTPMWSPVE
jgi:hypothetical protein